MSSTQDKCKNCLSHNNEGFILCYTPVEFNGKICPCLNCLVNPICRQFDNCEDWTDYHKAYMSRNLKRKRSRK